MTRISSLFVATTLAILPISAFAQNAPMKDTAPAGATNAAPATASTAGKTASAPMASAAATSTPTAAAPTVAGNTAAQMHNAPAVNTPTANATMGNATTANVTHPAKSAVKTSVPESKSEVHGMNKVNTHHAKVSAPSKTTEPTKS